MSYFARVCLYPDATFNLVQEFKFSGFDANPLAVFNGLTVAVPDACFEPLLHDSSGGAVDNVNVRGLLFLLVLVSLD